VLDTFLPSDSENVQTALQQGKPLTNVLMEDKQGGQWTRCGNGRGEGGFYVIF
jgi:hypothetical protein